MKMIWIPILLFAVAGCQPDSQEKPAQQQTVAAAKTVLETEQIDTTAELPVEKVPKPEQPTQSTQRQKPVAPPVLVPDAAEVVEPSSPDKSATAESQAATPVSRTLLSEADAMALARKKNCLACHTLDKKVVGPAWRSVAGKYRGEAAAQSMLEAKVRSGGKGNWGSVAMPAQPALTNEELSGLVQFVLQLQ